MTDPASNPARPASPRPQRITPLGVTLRLVLFALLWLIIAGADPGAWIIGVPAVALATFYAVRLANHRASRLSVRGVLRYIPYFLWQSLLGGTDVAVRVLRPQVRIAPGFQRYRVRLRNPHARVFFLDSISLLPGTLSADMRGGVIDVHALDARADMTPELADLERRVGWVFRENLPEAGAHD